MVNIRLAQERVDECALQDGLPCPSHEPGRCGCGWSHRTLLSAETYLLHDGENPGLGVVVPVGTDTQVDLLLKRIFAIGLHQAKKRVFGGRGDSGRSEDGGGPVGTHDV